MFYIFTIWWHAINHVFGGEGFACCLMYVPARGLLLPKAKACLHKTCIKRRFAYVVAHSDACWKKGTHRDGGWNSVYASFDCVCTLHLIKLIQKRIYQSKWFRKKRENNSTTMAYMLFPRHFFSDHLASLTLKKMLDFNHKDFLSRLKANFHCPFNLSLKLCIVFLFLIWAELLHTNTV